MRKKEKRKKRKEMQSKVMKDNISILDRARAHSSILMDNEGLAACQRSNEPVPVFRVLSSDKTTIGMRLVIFS
jgi:hypothetical protein